MSSTTATTAATTTTAVKTIKVATDLTFDTRTVVKTFLELLEKVFDQSPTIETADTIATFFQVPLIDAIEWIKNKDICSMTLKLDSILRSRRGPYSFWSDKKAWASEDVRVFMNTADKSDIRSILPYQGNTHKIILHYENSNSTPVMFEGKMTPLIYKFFCIFFANYAALPLDSTLRVIGYAFDDLEMENCFLSSIMSLPEGVSSMNQKECQCLYAYLQNIKTATWNLVDGKKSVVPEVLFAIVEKIKTIPGAQACLTQLFQEYVDSFSSDKDNIVKFVCVANKMGIKVNYPNFMTHAHTLDESKWNDFVKNAYREYMIELLLQKVPGKNYYLYHSLMVTKMINKYCQLHKDSMIDYLKTFVERMKSRVDPSYVITVQEFDSMMESFIGNSPAITTESAKLLMDNLRIIIDVFPEMKNMITKSGYICEYVEKEMCAVLFQCA
jgi:hypothetical protein